MRKIKKYTTSGAFVLADNAKRWDSVSSALTWISFRANKVVDPRLDLFCFASMIDGDIEKHKFSVFEFKGGAAIYLEWEDESGEYGRFLTETDMKDWEVNS